MIPNNASDKEIQAIDTEIDIYKLSSVHPNILQLIDIIEDNYNKYLVLEHV